MYIYIYVKIYSNYKVIPTFRVEKFHAEKPHFASPASSSASVKSGSPGAKSPFTWDVGPGKSMIFPMGCFKGQNPWENMGEIHGKYLGIGISLLFFLFFFGDKEWKPTINGHATGTDSLEVPTIFLRPKFQGISPQNMALYGTNVPPF